MATQYQLIHATDDCNGHTTEKVELVATKAACTTLLFVLAKRQHKADINEDHTYAGWITSEETEEIVHEYHVVPVEP